jgi:hypothetical protein
LNIIASDTLVGDVESLHRFGSSTSDTFLLMTNEFGIYLWDQNELDYLGQIFPDVDQTRSVADGPFLADFDRNGMQDLLFIYEEWGGTLEGEGGQYLEKRALLIVKNILNNNDLNSDEYLLNRQTIDITQTLPVDVDRDGGYEILGILGWDHHFNIKGLIALEINAEIADLNGDGRKEYLYLSRMNDISTDEDNDDGSTLWDTPLVHRSNAFEIKDYRMNSLTGFPICSRLWSPNCRFCQLDEDPQLELLMVTNQEFDVYEINVDVIGQHSIWWGQQYRDNDHSNAIWEPATPFSPANAAVLMPVDQCYNWPNPASDETRIRYSLNYTADVTVDIFDILGEKVTTFDRFGQAPGLPHEIPWQLNDIARGAYVAVVKAEGNGMSETKLVKIAVVK